MFYNVPDHGAQPAASYLVFGLRPPAAYGLLPDHVQDVVCDYGKLQHDDYIRIKRVWRTGEIYSGKSCPEKEAEQMVNIKYEESGLASEQEFLSGLTRHKLNETPVSSGIPFCYKDEEIYTDDSDSHTLIFGNIGTKKTRNFCIPNLSSIGD